MELLRNFYFLTKPGIVRGNAYTAAAGFFLAAHGHVRWALFFATLIGLSLIIASACVSNNFLDRNIDRKMERTRNRALANGTISTKAALVYAAVLGIAGALILFVYARPIAAWLALFGFVAYVFIYGYAKRRGSYGTVVGSISGAIPPVIGYTAVSGRLDLAAWLLFLIIVFWQMPHFYAIALFRTDDYKAAGIPVLPLTSGNRHTKWQILAYAFAFSVTAICLFLFGYAGWIYLIAVVIASCAWLIVGISGLRLSGKDRDIRFGRRMFGWSLVVVMLLCLAIIVDSFIS